MTVLSIDECPFLSAFGNDDGQAEYYLDLETGDLVVVADEDCMDDADEVLARGMVDADRDRYLRIPTYTRDDPRALLRDFLESEWTDDQQAKRAAESAFHAHDGRISGWRNDSAVDESTYFAFTDFEREHLRTEAARFLQEKGITAKWR